MKLKVKPYSGSRCSHYQIDTNTIYLCPDEFAVVGGRKVPLLPDFVLAHEMGHAALGHGEHMVSQVLEYEIGAHAWALRQRGKVTPSEARCILATEPLHSPDSYYWSAAPYRVVVQATALRAALVLCARSGRVTQVV